jgi:alpha-beta hydrolase superfamily lysophospholipase
MAHAGGPKLHVLSHAMRTAPLHDPLHPSSPAGGPSRRDAGRGGNGARPTPIHVPAGAAALPLKRVDERWLNRRGDDMHGVRWPLPRDAVRAGLVFSHGYNHRMSTFFDWLADRLAEHGIACFGTDHYGHGSSAGLPGFVPSFDDVVDDMLEWSGRVRRDFLPPGTPLFIYGESLGGAVALLASRRASPQYAGAVLFAPMCGLDPSMVPNPLLVAAGE